MTKSQEQLVHHIREFWRENRCPPSYTDLERVTGRDRGSLHHSVRRLRELGAIDHRSLAPAGEVLLRDEVYEPHEVIDALFPGLLPGAEPLGGSHD